MPRLLSVVWVVWLATLPAVAAFAWVSVEACMASTPGDDCGIVYMIPAAWLVPWLIGVAVLALGTVLFRRHPR